MKEYEALVERKRADDKRQRLNVGFVWAAILNTAAFADSNRRAAQPEDIVPGLTKEKRSSGYDLTKMSGEEQAAHFRKLFPKAVVVVKK